MLSLAMSIQETYICLMEKAIQEFNLDHFEVWVLGEDPEGQDLIIYLFI